MNTRNDDNIRLQTKQDQKELNPHSINVLFHCFQDDMIDIQTLKKYLHYPNKHVLLQARGKLLLLFLINIIYRQRFFSGIIVAVLGNTFGT